MGNLPQVVVILEGIKEEYGIIIDLWPQMNNDFYKDDRE